MAEDGAPAQAEPGPGSGPAPGLSPWLSALSRPVVALDGSGRLLGLNPAAARLLGLGEGDPVAAPARPFVELAVPETARGGFLEVLGLALSGVPWTGELSLGSEETRRPVHAEVAPVRRSGRVDGVLLSLDPVEPGHHDPAHLSERLTRLARVGAELQTAEDLKTLTDVVVSHLADAAGATTASLSVLVDDDTLAMVGVRGGVPDAAARFARYPADETTPAGAAVVSRRPLVLVGRQEIEDSFPRLELAAPGERSMLCLPLVIGARSVGVVTLSFPGRRAMDTAELEFFSVMADSCAQALERIRALETVKEQHEKLRFLAEASAELARDLDYERTLANVAWMAVPNLADWCAISLAQDSRLRTLAVAHRDPDKVALALELQERYPPDPDARTGNYQVLRTGETLLVADIPDSMLVDSARDEEHLRLLRSLSLRSALTVALKARGRVFGTITWVNGEDGRRFGPRDVELGEDLARRAGVAIDNALLLKELRGIADSLQAAVLPPRLPEPDGWELAASYTSAGRVDVGGDFYDVIPLADGRLAVLVGDVMGRGVDAAAAMSQMRAATRAVIAVDPAPDTVLRRLDLLFEQFPSEQLVSLLYGLVDPVRDQLQLACAGHPAPLLVRADGTAEYVEAAQGTILGAGPADRSVTSCRLAAGDLLLLFTDGLLERRDEDLHDGQERLLAESLCLPRPVTGADLDLLVRRMRDPTRDDDAAVIGLRRVPKTN